MAMAGQYHMRGGATVYTGYEDLERPTFEIRDVWEGNLEEEMAVIREIIQEYPYVAMVRVCEKRTEKGVV
eukprot:m.64970 g.64970  ORF g.64970 m.64970 type:complete len:70 (-) comp13959_c0_seq1:45-254(-)